MKREKNINIKTSIGLVARIALHLSKNNLFSQHLTLMMNKIL
jgi:hypothetical protein